MGTLQTVEKQTALVENAEPAPTQQEERHRRRIAALKAAEGLWKNRTDISKDGLEYQEQLRAEWP